MQRTYSEHVSSDDLVDDEDDDLDEGHDDQLKRRRFTDDHSERNQNGRGCKVTHKHPESSVGIVVLAWHLIYSKIW